MYRLLTVVWESQDTERPKQSDSINLVKSFARLYIYVSENKKMARTMNEEHIFNKGIDEVSM